MNIKNKIQDLFVKKNIPIICGLAGILLIMISYISGGLMQNKETDYNAESGYCEYLESKLENIISDATMSNNINVMITLQEELSQNTADTSVFGFNSKSSLQSTPISNRRIAGVMIVCKSLSHPEDFNTVKQAAATVLDISPDKIYIIGGK